MGVYKYYKVAYKREGAWGTCAFTDATTIGYLLGRLPSNEKALIHPSGVSRILKGATAVNSQEYATGQIWQAAKDLTGMYPVGIQNGVLLQLVMGKSSTANDTPAAGYYTHTITPPTAVAGVLPELDSVTLHHEKWFDTTSLTHQYLGCKVASLMLVCEREYPFLTGQVNWIAKKKQKAGYDLDTDPALPATANTDPFHFSNMTVTYDSQDISAFVQGVEVSINPDITPVFTHDWTGGSYIGHWVNALIEGHAKVYKLTLKMLPNSTKDLWDDELAQAGTKDIVIKWSRNSTYDYIQLTANNLWFESHSDETPPVGQEEVAEVVMIPEAVSWTVVDKLAGSVYGE